VIAACDTGDKTIIMSEIETYQLSVRVLLCAEEDQRARRLSA